MICAGLAGAGDDEDPAPSSSARCTSSSTAPRSGASPIPPATTTTSTRNVTRLSSTPHEPVPKGPRTPTMSPGPARHRARVTGPTSRTVCCRRDRRSRRELLTEMAASPTPNAVSMLNCPGRNSTGPPGDGLQAKRRDVVGLVTPADDAVGNRRHGAGAVIAGAGRGPTDGGSSGPDSASTVGTVEVEEADTGRLQALEEHGGHPFHQLRSRKRGRRRPCPAGRPRRRPRLPPRRRPGRRTATGKGGRASSSPTAAPGPDRLDDDRPPPGRVDLDGDPSPADKVEGVGRIALGQQQLAGAEGHVPGAARHLGRRHRRASPPAADAPATSSAIGVRHGASPGDVADDRTAPSLRPDGGRLLGEVDADRTPGDAPAAPHAARGIELVPPGRELVGEPLAVARGGGGADRAAVEVRVVEVEARRPERCRSTSPVRSVVSRTSLQKHVGQTRVQFPHARHRSATSSHRGCSRLRREKGGQPVGLEPSPDGAGGRRDDLATSDEIVGAGRGHRHPVQDVCTHLGTDSDHEPVVQI